MQTSQRLSSVFFLEVTAVWGKTYRSRSERFCILGQKTRSLGQDFVAARCLPVRDTKGTECKTVVRVQKH